MKTIIMSILMFLISMSGWCHSSEAMHYADQSRIFGLQRTHAEGFRSVCKAVNGVDSALPNMFKKRFKVSLTPNDHRYLGHNILDGDIPKSSIDYLYDKVTKNGYSGTRKQFAKVIGKMQQDYKNGVVKLAMEKLGKSKKQATAIVEILHDIHLLGDTTPDNRRIKAIPKLKNIYKNIKSNVGKIGLSSKSQSKVLKELAGLYDDAMKIAGKQGVQAASDYFLNGIKNKELFRGIRDLRLGKRLYEVSNAKMRGVLREVKVNGRKLKAVDVPVVTENGVTKTMDEFLQIHPGRKMELQKAVGKAKKRRWFDFGKKKGTCKVVQGTSKVKKFLSTPKGAGLSAGIITFVVDETVCAVQYSEGEIAADQFIQKTMFNTGKAAAIAGATMVTLAFSTAPLAAATGSFAVCIAIESTGDYLWAEYDKAYGVLGGVSEEELFCALPDCVRERKVVFEEEIKVEKSKKKDFFRMDEKDPEEVSLW